MESGSRMRPESKIVGRKSQSLCRSSCRGDETEWSLGKTRRLVCRSRKLGGGVDLAFAGLERMGAASGPVARNGSAKGPYSYWATTEPSDAETKPMTFPFPS